MCQLSCSDLENSFLVESESTGTRRQGGVAVPGGWIRWRSGLDGSLDQMEQIGSSQVPAVRCCHNGTV